MDTIYLGDVARGVATSPPSADGGRIDRMPRREGTRRGTGRSPVDVRPPVRTAPHEQRGSDREEQQRSGDRDRGVE